MRFAQGNFMAIRNTKQTPLRQIVEETKISLKDLQLRYIGCNKEQANFLGLNSPTEIYGTTDYSFFSPAKADELRKNDQTVILGKTPGIFEEELLTLNGNSGTFLTQRIPLFNEEKELIGLSSISFDITAKKSTAKQYSDKQSLAEITLTNIINLLPGHVYWKDQYGVFKGCNIEQAKSAGFTSPEEMIGKTDYEMPWRKEAAILQASDLTVIKTKKALTREEYSQLAGSDNASIFLSKKTPLIDKDGNAIGVIGISFDITDRKKMEEELAHAKIAAEAAGHAKTEFIANMSHDLRTPLTGIIGLSKLLQNKALSLEEKQYINLISQSGEQLLNLLNDILISASVNKESDRDVKEACFDLHQCLNNLVQLERPAIQAKQLEMRIAIAANVPRYVISDRTKIYRILLNLIGNALKFTAKGFIALEVSLMTQEKEQIRLCFKVSDTGVGITPEMQEKIFERFFKKAHFQQQNYQGHGIGLHLVKTYVDLLGGKLNVSSQLGKGTTFSIELELKIGHNALESIDIIEEENRPFPIVSTKKPHLLLIEDNQIALKVLETITTDAGAHYTSVTSGEKALTTIKEIAFDMILTDINLPDISGNELSRRIRAWETKEKKKPTPIVGLTAHALENVEKECLQSGMMKVLTKPLTINNMEALIDEFVLNNKK